MDTATTNPSSKYPQSGRIFESMANSQILVLSDGGAQNFADEGDTAPFQDAMRHKYSINKL